MTGVVIRGGGAAAYGSAYLLRKGGLKVTVQRSGRARLPVLMLSDAARSLIQDVFEEPQLFCGSHRIRKRIVAWGKDAEPRVLEHSATVVSEEELLQSLGSHIDFDDDDDGARSNWSILSSPPIPVATIEQRFGSRTAAAMKVTLRPGADSSACWIEALEQGWLFLIPNTAGAGWLLSVGQPPGVLLAESRLVRMQILGRGSCRGEFPAYPRILSPLCGPGWLACGTTAMAFDPICGDGTAHAIREAILAAAVIRSANEGEDVPSLLKHYEARLTAGFARHLELCLNFYRSGFGGPWWEKEAESLEQGIRWCARQSVSFTEYRYRLSGFELRAAG
jgi:hypothetical protein